MTCRPRGGGETWENMNGCVMSGTCGGCAYAEMSYEEQLALKTRQLEELLADTLDAGSVWEGVLASPARTAYRNKMEYSFGDEHKGGPLALGMHKRKSFYDIVTCGDCRIVHEDFNLIVRATLEYFAERGTSYFHKKSHEGWLRHLLLRRSFASGDILADLITTGQDPGAAAGGCPDSCADGGTAGGEEALLAGWRDRLLSLRTEGRISGILHTRNDAAADAVIDQGTEVLSGRDFLEEELLGLKFRISPFSFFQTNPRGAELLYGKVREYVGDTRGQTVYDLYCGTGTIAQLTAAVADRVYGVELVPEAVEAARLNARANGIGNCEFIAGDVLKVIDSLERRPDLIVLDPPRDGLHPKMLPKVAAFGAENIVYVACRPASFVRDMQYFAGCGYRVVRACGVAMFPFTKNTEAVCLLGRRKETA